ncbi:MAG TPA: YciI family protein, partial [Chthoniobacterales bacterium]|nr:YciI family protein [Chthoniobacterales bacterium]
NVITDGPFGESKEAIGGYWFILARDLDEAAQIAKDNPCLDSCLFFEIRPIDPQLATPDNTR